MLNTVTVEGSPTEEPGEPKPATYEDLTRVTVDGSDDTEYHCKACGQPLTQYADSFSAEDGGPWVSECEENPPADDAEDQSTHGPHVPEYTALAWLNNANVELDESSDDVTVSISTTESDGAFTFSIHRVTDPTHENYGKLILIMPYPEAPGLHLAMTKIADGGYLLH